MGTPCGENNKMHHLKIQTLSSNRDILRAIQTIWASKDDIRFEQNTQQQKNQ